MENSAKASIAIICAVIVGASAIVAALISRGGSQEPTVVTVIQTVTPTTTATVPASDPPAVGGVVVSSPSPSPVPGTQSGTSTNSVTRTSAPTSTPTPTPTILYEAAWERGTDGWILVPGWRVVGGMLLSNPAEPNYQNRILAPFEPKTSDYAIEAEMQSIGGTSPFFGLLYRSCYMAGIESFFRSSAYIGLTDKINSGFSIARQLFDPGQRWRVYRIEVKANQARLLIDGNLVVEGVDNACLEPGKVGIYGGSQVAVRRFRVFDLDR